MIIRHVWSVLCSQSLVDTDSRNISLIGVIEEVHIKKETLAAETQTGTAKSPFVLPIAMEWVTLWERAPDGQPGIGHAKDIALDPSGEIIAQREYDVDLSTHKRTRWRRQFARLAIREPGRYQFCTQVKDEKRNAWESVSVVPLEVFIE